MRLRYTVVGSGSDGVTFEVTGEVSGDSPLDPDAHHAACRASFQQLTSGRAVFGQPGKGCRGPYDVTRLVLEKP